MVVWVPCQQALQGLVDAGRGGLVCRGRPSCRCTCTAARLWSELQGVPSWCGSVLPVAPQWMLAGMSGCAGHALLKLS